MEKWIEILKAGNYPQGDISIEDLRLMAQSYDTGYMAAPVISKHRQFNDKGELINNEPALGWIKALKASDGSLYALFENPEDLQNIYDGKNFRYASAEIQTELIKNKKVPYLGALAITNFPASKIKSIKLTGEEEIKVYTQKIIIQEDKMDLIKLCKVLKIDEKSNFEQVVAEVTKLTERAEAKDKLESILSLIKEDKPADPGKKKEETDPAIEKLTNTVNTLIEKFDRHDATTAEQVFDQAVQNKKVLPSQKEVLVGTKEKPGTFYKNASGLKAFVDTLPVLQLTTKIELPKNKDNKPMTYAQITNDLKLYSKMRKDNPEHLEALRQEWLQSPESQIEKKEG